MSNAEANAGVAELADAHDSKSCGAIRAGSSPATGIRYFLLESHICSMQRGEYYIPLHRHLIIYHGLQDFKIFKQFDTYIKYDNNINCH